MKHSVASGITLAGVFALVVFSGVAASRSGNAQTDERVVKITARKFTYEPNEIELKLGEPVVLELTSKDVLHGFNIPDLGLRSDVEPGETARVRLVPQKPGRFEFHCDNFCGIDHEDMSAAIVVK